MTTVVFGDGYEVLDLIGADPMEARAGHAPIAIGVFRVPDSDDAGAFAALNRLGRVLVRKCIINAAPEEMVVALDVTDRETGALIHETARRLHEAADEAAAVFADYEFDVTIVLLFTDAKRRAFAGTLSRVRTESLRDELTTALGSDSVRSSRHRRP